MHACSACTKAKRACDHGQPCGACRNNSSECSYIRPDRSDGSLVGRDDDSSQQSQNNGDHNSRSNRAKNSESTHPRISIEFLLNYTKPVQHYQSLPDFFTTFPTSNDSTPSVIEVASSSNYVAIEEGFMQHCMPATLDIDYEWDEITSSASFEYLDTYETRLQARLTELAHQLNLGWNNGNHLGSKPNFSTATILTVGNLIEAKRLFFAN